MAGATNLHVTTMSACYCYTSIYKITDPKSLMSCPISSLYAPVYPNKYKTSQPGYIQLLKAEVANQAVEMNGLGYIHLALQST
jgi:hypothetical protein